MVSRSYLCRTCGIEFETFTSIKEPVLKDCECGGKVERTYYEAPNVAVEPEISTIGQLAARNSKNNGSQWVAEQRHKDLERQRQSRIARRAALEGKLPAGAKLAPMYEGEKHKVDMSLTKMTPEQTKRYIETGKKPAGL